MRIPILLLAAALALPLFAQDGQRMEQTQIRAGSPDRERAPEAKITKEDRKHAMQLLESSEGPARGMRDSSTRAYALFQLARAYQQSDKAKAIELYKEAFTASIAGIEELDPHVKREASMAPQQILLAMIPLAPDKVDELLPQLAPQARERVVTQLLGYYIRTRQSDRGLQMIQRIGQEKEIPYGAVSKLMETYGPDHADDRQQLFTVALASFRDHQADHNGFTGGPGDFGTLITQNYKDLPSSLIMQAIDTVLTQARKIDSEAKDQGRPRRRQHRVVERRRAVEWTI